MKHIATYSAPVQLPIEQAWLKLKDLSLANQYVPGIDRCTITTQQRDGVGASRRVSGPQKTLDETVTQWNDGSGFTLRLHDGDKNAFPFDEASFSYRIDPINTSSCQLTCTMTYVMRWGAVGNLLHNALLTKIIRAQIRDVTLSTAWFYETGSRASKSDILEMRSKARSLTT